MPETTTRVVVPTAAQYEALIVPPPTRLTPTQLFEYQTRCYANAGIMTHEELEPLREHFPENGSLFLATPSKPQFSDKRTLDALIAKLTHNGKHGVNNLNPQILEDDVAVPQGVYLITDVDDGRAMLHVAPRDARAQLARQHRSPFTWWEGYCLYLCFGFAIFGHHNVDCSGSRTGSETVPSFYLVGDEPRFDDLSDLDAGPEWGSASCVDRIGV